MPQIDVTRKELEALIEAILHSRLYNDGTPEEGILLMELHLKLENALELWIHGATVEIPVPEHFKKLGVSKWEVEHPPHPDKGDVHAE
jgi:hypothetical protein